MHELKNIAGIAATMLVFLGYIPYLRDIIKGKTKPHIYSWLVGGFVGFIIFALQVSGGAGTGSLVTLAAGSMCLFVIVLGIIHKSTVEILWIDTVFFLLAFLALGLWLVAKQPVISAILSTVIEVLGFVPTVRKSWNKPFTETLQSYYLNTFRFGFAIFALQTYSIVTIIYPVTWVLFNGFFAVMLVIRRKQVS
ncbi:MAG: hypothetical protein KGJ07_04950 [Patescibacteria group bacterium]|nr:hypothetical protein [Patescibacteria group bacterium]